MPYLKISSSPADRRGVLTEAAREPGSGLRRGRGEPAGREGQRAAPCLPVLGVPTPPDGHRHPGGLCSGTPPRGSGSCTCSPACLPRAGCRSDGERLAVSAETEPVQRPRGLLRVLGRVRAGARPGLGRPPHGHLQRCPPLQIPRPLGTPLQSVRRRRRTGLSSMDRPQGGGPVTTQRTGESALRPAVLASQQPAGPRRAASSCCESRLLRVAVQSHTRSEHLLPRARPGRSDLGVEPPPRPEPARPRPVLCPHSQRQAGSAQRGAGLEGPVNGDPRAALPPPTQLSQPGGLARAALSSAPGGAATRASEEAGALPPGAAGGPSHGPPLPQRHPTRAPQTPDLC